MGLVARYKAEFEKDPVCILFFSILTIFLVLFIILMIITGGTTAHYILFSDRADTFMDHFNSIMHAAEGAYTNLNVIYPPIAVAFYTIMGYFLLPFVDTTLVGRQLAFEMRSSQMGMMSYFVMVFIILYIIYILISKLAKEKVCNTDVLFLLIFLSLPFIYAIERGNSILFAVMFSFMFLVGYRSDNKWIRYLSYIALGCAAGFKLYPAIFSLLILRDRKYKEFLICATIVISLVAFLPFIFIEGNFLIVMNNIFSYAAVPSTSGGFINISQLVFLVFGTALPTDSVSLLSNTILILVSAVSFIVILFDKDMKQWKAIALISCNLVLGPSVPATYLYTYIAIPVVYFLISEKKLTTDNYLFLICFAIVLAMFPGFGPSSLSVIRALKSISVMIIMATILSQGLSSIHKNRRRIERRTIETAIEDPGT